MLVGTLITTVVGSAALVYVGRYNTLLFTFDAIVLGASIGVGALMGRSANPIVPLGAAVLAVVGFILRSVMVNTWAFHSPPGALSKYRIGLFDAFGKVVENYDVSRWTAQAWIVLVAGAVVAGGLALLGNALSRKKPQGVPGMPAGPGFAPPPPPAAPMAYGGPAQWGGPSGPPPAPPGQAPGQRGTALDPGPGPQEGPASPPVQP
jgi:hypothetical protein